MSKVPRKRGRPRKNPLPTTSNDDGNASQLYDSKNQNVKVPKKRGRKPKKKVVAEGEKPKPKKRGRKPKGGKILKKEDLMKDVASSMQQNIILQLKCSSNDLNKHITELSETINYTPNINDPQAFSMNQGKINSLLYEELKTNQNNLTPNENEYKSNNSNQPFLNDSNSRLGMNINKMNNMDNSKTNVIIKKNNWSKDSPEEKESDNNEKISIKSIWDKINKLKQNLRYNNVSDKRSACFWCTCPFDNPAIHIPKEITDGKITVYGCFCSPECAVAHLKNEHIDTSTRWERYAMLNNIYGKIYNYDKNIKPAPSPYYILDKYYGNMSIKEYRKLLENNTIFMVVDKPMTKMLPELCEENNEYPDVNNNLLDAKTSTNKYRLKRNTVKKTKQDYLINNFT